MQIMSSRQDNTKNLTRSNQKLEKCEVKCKYRNKI